MSPPSQDSPGSGSGAQRQVSRSSSMDTVKIDANDEEWDLMEPLSPKISPSYEYIYLAGAQPRIARHNLVVGGIELKGKEVSTKVETALPALSNAKTSAITNDKPVGKRDADTHLDDKVAVSKDTTSTKPKGMTKQQEELARKCPEPGSGFNNTLDHGENAPNVLYHFVTEKSEPEYKPFKLNHAPGGHFVNIADPKALGEKVLKKQENAPNAVSHYASFQEATSKMKAVESQTCHQQTWADRFRGTRQSSKHSMHSYAPWKAPEYRYASLSPPPTPPSTPVLGVSTGKANTAKGDIMELQDKLKGFNKTAGSTMNALQGAQIASHSSEEVLAQEIANKIRIAEAGTEDMALKESVTSIPLKPVGRKVIEAIFANPDLARDGEVPVMYSDVTNGTITNLKYDEKNQRITYTCQWTGRNVTEDGWGLDYFCPHSEEMMMTRFSTPWIAEGKCCEDKPGFVGKYDRFSSW